MKTASQSNTAISKAGIWETIKRALKKDDNIPAYIMIAPMLLGFLIFTIYPIIYVVRWAFFDYDGFTNAKFIALDNFIRVFTRDENFWNSVVNTGIVTAGKMAIEIPLALVIAVLINSKSKVNNFFRTIFFMPTIVSMAIVGLIFSILFGSYSGIVNTLLINIGVTADKINWFGDKWLAMAVVILAAVWSHYGINMVFFLMGLQSIPKELYECADIDGANRIQQFFKVTVPMLKPIMQTILMLALVEGMKMSELVLVLTNGQPGGQTEVVMTYIYKYFFPTDSMSGGLIQYGYASSLAVVTAVIIGIVTIIYLRLSKKMSEI